MSRTAKDLMKMLQKDGFIFKRSKGSHHIYYNETKNITVVVPVHGKKDLPKGTWFGILKQARLK